jgi:hypothetical protein
VAPESFLAEEKDWYDSNPLSTNIQYLQGPGWLLGHCKALMSDKRMAEEISSSESGCWHRSPMVAHGTIMLSLYVGVTAYVE